MLLFPVREISPVKIINISTSTLPRSRKLRLVISRIISMPRAKNSKPEPTVTLNGVTLKKDIDYTLSYFNNTRASSGTNRPRVHITGIGIYRSGFSKYFTINPLKISGETIQLADPNCESESVTSYICEITWSSPIMAHN